MIVRVNRHDENRHAGGAAGLPESFGSGRSFVPPVSRS
jgi:hypothetical protein